MTTRTGRIGRRMLAVATMGALAFGASQALAAPAEAKAPAACDRLTCASKCRSLGYTGGACFGDQCRCYTVEPT